MASLCVVKRVHFTQNSFHAEFAGVTTERAQRSA